VIHDSNWLILALLLGLGIIAFASLAAGNRRGPRS
jgi:hypothetical protein